MATLASESHRFISFCRDGNVALISLRPASPEDLAFKAGVDRSYVSILENDKKTTTVQMLCRLCQTMNASPPRIIKVQEAEAKDGIYPKPPSNRFG